MFAARQRFVLLLIAGLCRGAYRSSVEEQQEDTDAELTAGYFQGDMDVKFQRNGLIAPIHHWPNATVHYKIDEAFDTEYTESIKWVMDSIAYDSCIRFVPATPETLDYVLIVKSYNGCYSNVGFLRGKQKLHLQFPGCHATGSIMHEILHTLGFFHQQSSSDRDKYIKVIWENIEDGKANNFEKYGANVVDNFGAEYDYRSVMHYPYNAFAKNKSMPTIVALQPGGELQMGQRRGLSDADIIRLNNMYKCPSKNNETD